MTEKENLLLRDKETYPSDDLIFSIIGEKKKLWQSIMSFMQGSFKDSAGEWNFYNDGKRWLFKMIYKKKTVFWLGLVEDTFRITFWFADRAEVLINESTLPAFIKDEFKVSKKYGAIRGISVTVYDDTDVDNVLKLIDIKSRIK